MNPASAAVAADADAPPVILPSRFAAARWEAKAALLRLRRAFHDAQNGDAVRYVCSTQNAPAFPVLLAESRTPLWSDTRLAERRLQLGKAQNLRQAVKHFHNLSVPANQTVSFWKQVGRATKRRGFAPGREIREGCIIPTLGGGLCQLSNALHQVALDTDCAEVTERHAHSRRVPGSHAQETGRDATVFWNYLDLRFRFAHPVRMEAFLTDKELVVRVFGPQQTGKLPQATPTATPRRPFPRLVLLDPAETAPSCASCQQDDCFRAEDANENKNNAQVREITAFLMDAKSPEVSTYLSETRQKTDTFAAPLNGKKWRVSRFAWDTDGFAHPVAAPDLALRQSLILRYLARTHAPPARVRAAQLEMAAQMARHLAHAALFPDVSHVCIAQAFLPALWDAGILGGRTYDVWMSGLPLAHLHARLDDAFATYPDRALLADFRAPVSVVQAETAALARARRIITPHAEIAALFGDRAHLVPWILPPAPAAASDGLTATQRRAFAFSGPTTARKNAHAVRDAARLLDAEVVLLYPLSGEHEGPNFWEGVRTSRPAPGTDWRIVSGASVLVSPDLTCERPRAALSALAAGIPVCATPACGLGERPGVTTLSLHATGAEIANAVAPFLSPANH